MSNKVEMIALRSHYYGRDLNADEVYEATEADAVLLERVEAAKRKPKSKKEYKTRVMVPEA